MSTSQVRDERSQGAPRRLVLPALALILVALAAAGPRPQAAAREEKPMANPLEQRAEMIALLRSIDGHLKAIESELAEKKK